MRKSWKESKNKHIRKFLEVYNFNKKTINFINLNQRQKIFLIKFTPENDTFLP